MELTKAFINNQLTVAKDLIDSGNQNAAREIVTNLIQDLEKAQGRGRN